MMLSFDLIQFISHIESNWIKTLRRLCIAFIAVSLCACTTAGMFSPTVELSPDTDKVASAAATEQPQVKDPKSEGCAELTPPSARPLTNDAGAKMLSDDFDAVRVEHGISRISFSAKAYNIPFSQIVDEVKLLRAAKAEEIANHDAKSPASPNTDPVEDVIVSKLPLWAGDKNVTLPGMLAQVNAAAADAASAPQASTDALPEPAQDAIAAASRSLELTTTKASPLNALIDAARLNSKVNNNNNESATFQRSDHKRLFEDLQTLQVLRAFHFLTLISAVRLHTLAHSAKPPDDDTLKTEIRIFNLARFLSTYFDAYFRSGHFLAVTDNGDALLKLGSDGFVSRAGMSTQFAGVDYAVTTKSTAISLQHTYPSVAQFGPQLVRVFVEAVFDANGLSPMAVSNSTACTQKLFDKSDCIDSSDKNAQTAEQVIGQLDQMASASEALTTAATGAILRGVNVVALNNEAVAQVLETFVGVNARKITEKLLYLSSTRTLSGKGTRLICPAQPVPAALKVQ